MSHSIASRSSKAASALAATWTSVKWYGTDRDLTRQDGCSGSRHVGDEVRVVGGRSADRVFGNVP